MVKSQLFKEKLNLLSQATKSAQLIDKETFNLLKLLLMDTLRNQSQGRIKTVSDFLIYLPFFFFFFFPLWTTEGERKEREKA